MDLGLKGRKCIVTGATKGIGLATAKQFAAEGADLAICSRNVDDVNAVVELLQAEGVEAYGDGVDLFDEEAYTAWLKRAARDLGGVDVFVANVTGGSSLGSAAAEAWQEFFDVDLMGAVRGFDTLLPFLTESDDAAVVFVGTTAALEHFPVSPPGYAALKAASVVHANTLAQIHGRKGIRVNAVSPGTVYDEGGAWAQIEAALPDVFNKTVRSVPLGRMGTPEEIARYIAFVASPAGSYISGANCVIDGGLTKAVG
ncbi:MAG: SDR family oxidoreductase [Pseudomonadota bacterium]